MLSVNEKIARLRAQMKAHAIDAYYIGTADPHNSEYIAPYYMARAWLSGFTGSAGTAVVTQEKALIWADGRYHIQAEAQLSGSDFELMKQGAPGVPSVEEWLEKSLTPGTRLGADGRLLPEAVALRMEEKLSAKKIELLTGLDLIGLIWDDRPPLPSGEIFHHDVRYTGLSVAEKIAKVREKMDEDKADYALYVGLDDIAWLMNFRGSDVPNNAVAMAFALVTKEEAFLFIDPVKVNDTEEERFLKEGVAVKPYMSIEASLSALSSGVLVADKNRVSRSLIHALPPDVILLNKRDYPYLMKAVLNDVELASQFKAGIRDSVAVSRYLYYVKHVAVKEGLNEIEVAEKLRELRQESDQFIIESFPTISAYGKNAAMMHYQATPEQYSQLQPRGLYLVDCGAQSYDGTTDITRTVSLGALTEEERRDYTETLKSHIQLASLPFLDGTSGVALDAVARSSMWRYGLDYKCGTGHGFGFVSGVHEGPQRLTHVPRFGDYGFREHIVITIEPGVYREGKHGIRLENDYVVLKINCEAVIDKGEIHFEENEYPLNEAGDQFLRFQTMTFVPFDRDAIDKNRLSPDELAWLNDYHEAVRALILPFLEGDEYDFVYRETERL